MFSSYQKDEPGTCPSTIVGYHDNINNTWYNTDGLEIFDLNPLAEAAGGKLSPYFKECLFNTTID